MFPDAVHARVSEDPNARGSRTRALAPHGRPTALRTRPRPVTERPVTEQTVTEQTVTGQAVAERAGHCLELPGPTQVERITPHGPILTGDRAPMRRLRADTLTQVLSARDRILVAVLSVCWVAAFVAFWVWWFAPAHRLGWVGFAINSVLLFYLAYMPAYFLVAVNRLRGVNPELAVPDLRVAFVVTKAPSEPWEVARTTLTAMRDQDFPHEYDVWLCDEQPDEQTRRWCDEHGVAISSRYLLPGYHRETYPRRTKCKEGNLAYFYDTVGYDRYDVVAQLDCDHVPSRTYLAEMVRPFGDSAVGYVAAPSMNDAHAAASWSNRGRIQREATFHGPAQLGHNDGLAPSCIGSHYAVRTQALREIGGIGPELAEDFSTSFLLTSAGYQGVFAHRAEAHGEGPPTFGAMLTQEFQWSRSLTVLALRTAPSHLGRLSWPLRVRFSFALCFYAVLGLTMIASVLLPVIPAVSGHNWVNVNYIAFLAHWLFVPVWIFVLVLFLRRRGLWRPVDSPVIAWEVYLYTLAKWPYILRGVLAGVRQSLQPTRRIVFAVTPKGGAGMEPLLTRLTLPYAAISLVGSSAVLYAERFSPAFGYAFLSLILATSYAILSLAVPLLHAVEAARASGRSFPAALRTTAWVPALVGLLVWIPLLAALIAFPGYVATYVGSWDQLLTGIEIPVLLGGTS